MTIMIDQSGKVEKTNEDTVIAAAGKKPFTVLLPSAVKRKIAEAIKQGRMKKYRRYPVIRIFAACVFLSLERLTPNDAIIIDYEYKGHDNQIKSILLNYIRKKYPTFRKGQIAFVEIGKQVAAHTLAYETYKKKLKPSKTISENELILML